MSSFLKKLKKPFSIKRLLHSNLAVIDPPRSIKTLHASELTQELEFCPRHFALLDLEDKTLPASQICTSLNVTFQTGRMIEWKLRNEWLVDHAVGRWLCMRCDRTSKWGKRPTVCIGCGTKAFEYIETRFDSVTCGASCGVDLLVSTPSGKHRAVECKIMDKDQFRDLMMPLAEHRLRTRLYLRIIEDSDHPEKDRIDTTTATVLYVSRSYGFKDEEVYGYGVKDQPFSPFKEFEVKRASDTSTDHLFERAKQLKAHREGGPLPERICDTPLCKRASSCTMVKPCFSGKYIDD